MRARRLEGLKFKRQVDIGRYLVDFYCRERKLVVEVDGGIHQEIDQLQRLRVLRVTNEEVHADLAATAGCRQERRSRGDSHLGASDPHHGSDHRHLGVDGHDRGIERAEASSALPCAT